MLKDLINHLPDIYLYIVYELILETSHNTKNVR